MKKSKKVFLGNTYLTVYSIFFLLSCATLSFYLTSHQTWRLSEVVIFYNKYTFAFFLLWGSTLVLALVFIWNGYEYYGIARVKEDCVTLSAPFRKKYVFRYEDIVDIGIDYANNSGIRMWYLYISKDPLPMKYTHRMNRLPYSKRCIRISWDERLYDELCKVLPKDLRKSLERSKTIFHAYKEKGLRSISQSLEEERAEL